MLARLIVSFVLVLIVAVNARLDIICKDGAVSYAIEDVLPAWPTAKISA